MPLKSFGETASAMRLHMPSSSSQVVYLLHLRMISTDWSNRTSILMRTILRNRVNLTNLILTNLWMNGCQCAKAVLTSKYAIPTTSRMLTGHMQLKHIQTWMTCHDLLLDNNSQLLTPCSLPLPTLNSQGSREAAPVADSTLTRTSRQTYLC